MLTAVGVHIFAGGFSLGASRHVDLLAHLETSEFGAETWHRNAPSIPSYIDEDRNWDGLELHPDLVYGNPPCSGFSNATKAELRGPESHLNQGIRDVVAQGRRLGAKTVVIESVRGLATRGKLLRDELQKLSQYGHSYLVPYDAGEYGVFQKRPRVFWVLSDAELMIPEHSPLPRPDLAEALRLPPDAANNEPWPDSIARWTRSELEQAYTYLKPGGRPVLIGEGGDESLLPLRFQNRRIFTACLPRRLSPNKPLTVARSDAFLCHPDEPRYLTVRELARLMGYPDDFVFVGSQGRQCAQVSKGICPPTGEWIIKAIVNQ